jgi:type IV pilus assembly protein PilC
MIEGGIPITTALETIARDQDNLQFQQIIFKILERINKGKSFASSISDFPNVFNRLAFSIILAGETSGNLPISLHRLASYFTDKDKLAKKLQAATAYPLFIFVFIISIVIFIMAFIVPRFKMIFKQFGGQLPAFTQIFLNIYDFLQHNIIYVLAVMIVLLILSILAYTRTEKGHYMFSKIKLRIPLLGNLFVQSFIVMFCKTMATLLAAGVSIIEIFDILIAMTDNDVIKTEIIRTKKYIIEGSNIHLSAAATGFFPGLVVEMMQVGEESGSLPQVLDKTAEHYERKVDASITTVTSILEPLMIVAAGVIVMIVVIALYLPIFTMSKVPK